MIRRVMNWFGTSIGARPRGASVPAVTPAPDSLTPAQKREAEERKLRSHSVLEAERVPINPHLPWVEPSGATRIRSGEEIARRALGAMACSGRSHGVPPDTIAKMLGATDVAPYLTPEEASYFTGEQSDERTRVRMSWRMESACALLWSVSYVESLGRPDQQCGGPELLGAFKNGADMFIAGARRRPENELLDAADLIYRYHWAVRDEMLNGRPAPAGLDPGIVQERHHALNWIVGYMDSAEWDDVTTDT